MLAEAQVSTQVELTLVVEVVPKQSTQVVMSLVATRVEIIMQPSKVETISMEVDMVDLEDMADLEGMVDMVGLEDMVGMVDMEDLVDMVDLVGMVEMEDLMAEMEDLVDMEDMVDMEVRFFIANNACIVLTHIIIIIINPHLQ